ncbi:unnamed protein product [Sphagnum jensenii]|uniref:PsbP C-terminal domain-containing protein n=1 Tax=Sphagnum jensenii TaxID=128206 RepID=A0ABP0X2U5_9BRYO
MGVLGMSLLLQLNLPPASSTLPCISPAQGSSCRRRIFLGGRGAGRSVRRKDGVRSGRKQLGFLVAASLQDEKEAATTSSLSSSSSSSSTKSFEESSSDTSVVSSSSAAAASWVVPRRFVLGTSVGLLVALGANFLGVTSALLSLNPALSRAARVDVLYPVQGYKRCLETSRGFEFIYPAQWVGDQRLLYRAVERAERERSLDLPSLQQQQNRRRSIDPVVAFGPPGSNGELNVSIVVAPTLPSFTLEKLGGPKEAGETLLHRFIAPEGSNKVANLVNAERRDDMGVVFYTLEFTVEGPAFSRHNVAVYATSSGELFSLNAQSPKALWPNVQNQFREMANSFRLLR